MELPRSARSCQEMPRGCPRAARTCPRAVRSYPEAAKELCAQPGVAAGVVDLPHHAITYMAARRTRSRVGHKIPPMESLCSGHRPPLGSAKEALESSIQS